MYRITFGTDGWRAVIAEHFTFANVGRVASAVGRYVSETYHKNGKKVPVVIGYDTRFLADRFALHAAQTLISQGVPAKLSSRDVPTPAIAWAAQTEPTAGAIQLTASHNPPEYCGMKYIPDYAGPATNEITERILALLPDAASDDVELASVDVARFDPKPPYMKALRDRIDLDRIAAAKLRVGCDCLYSTSRDYLDALLSESGVETKVLHDWRDPLFGGGMPEPKAEFLQELSNLVRMQGLDAGLTTDGDADRLAVVDDTGTYLSANQLLALLLRHLVKNKGMSGAVVRTVATTHLLDRLAEQYGLEVLETPVGFKYIGEIMRQRDILIGGEESGGISIKGHIPEKDGIFSNMLIVEMMAYERKPLSSIWADLVRESGKDFAYRRRDLRLTSRSQKDLIQKMDTEPFRRIGDFDVVQIKRLDGLKYYLADGSWVLFRPSGTEPLVRLYYEAPTSRRADELKLDFDRQLEELMSKLGTQMLSLKH